MVISTIECLRLRAAARENGGRWQHDEFAPGVIVGVIFNPPCGFGLCLEARHGRLTEDLIRRAMNAFFPSRPVEPAIRQRSDTFFRCDLIDPRAPSWLDPEVIDAIARHLMRVDEKAEVVA